MVRPVDLPCPITKCGIRNKIKLVEDFGQNEPHFVVGETEVAIVSFMSSRKSASGHLSSISHVTFLDKRMQNLLLAQAGIGTNRERLHDVSFVIGKLLWWLWQPTLRDEALRRVEVVGGTEGSPIIHGHTCLEGSD